jgi:hypothetical protein
MTASTKLNPQGRDVQVAEPIGGQKQPVFPTAGMPAWKIMPPAQVVKLCIALVGIGFEVQQPRTAEVDPQAT